MEPFAGVQLGTVLPHRSPEHIDQATVVRAAARAEALGFTDLWVTENNLDPAFSFEPMMLLAHAAAVTTTIKLGVAVMVLPVQQPARLAHQGATLDQLSNGRALLAVGIGRDHHYHEFEIPVARRVTRFREGLEVVRGLWREPVFTYDGEFYRLKDAEMAIKPQQAGGVPIWIGAGHPDGVRRSAKLGDGWMGAGSHPTNVFVEGVKILRDALEEQGRDVASYPISKRVFIVFDDNRSRARERMRHWFDRVYRAPDLTDSAGVFGSVAEVREQLAGIVAAGANHLVINPVDDFEAQLELSAEAVGLSA